MPEELKGFLDAINNTYHEFDSDRKMLERSLDLSSQELLQAYSEIQAIFQAIPDLTFRIDRDGKILSLKAGDACDFFGKIETIYGKRIQDVPPKSIGDKFQEAIDEVNNFRSLVSFEYACSGTGAEQYYESRMLPLSIEQNIVIIRNITKRIQAEKELIKAKEKAEENDRLKSAFLQNISHEIRTPLNAIISFTKFLSEHDVSAHDKNYYSQIINDQSDVLLRIVEDILDISKIEVGQMNIIESDFNLEGLMVELNEYYKLKIILLDVGQDVALNYIFDQNLKDTTVIIDGQRLRQILVNLLDNAFKFTKRGSITFGCEVTSNAELFFFVKDTGIGIPLDKQDIVFDRFRQAEDLLTARSYGGAGLGLSIVKGLVNLMKGKVWFESQIGEGSSFYFTLPLIMPQK